MAPFGGITDDDASDIANYFLSIPPKHNIIAGTCSVPSAESTANVP